MTHIHVYLADRAERDIKVATIHTTTRRGRLSSVFTYDSAYLASADAYPLDPALPLRPGAWPSRGALPRAIADAAPDRWGRMLIAKREAALAREEGRVPRLVDDAGFLLGVADETRQGALRFALSDGGPFQHPAPEVPKLIDLPGLFHAATLAAREGSEANDAVKALLNAGSASLGGARPKAAVRDASQMLIAKFSHASDQWNVMAWEAVALDLARGVGITVPDTRLIDIGGSTVLLSRRFDRDDARRVPYVSALTLIEADDGAHADYLDIAQALARVSADPSRDLADLWRRIALSVAIHNTDDHPRNLGFLRSKRGWSPGPAFDLNPDPSPATTRVTSLAGAVGGPDTAAALVRHAAAFGLSGAAARAEASSVADVVATWRVHAERRGLDKAAQTLFGPNFATGIDALRRL
ncbi:MAG: type II toxin-antitoxin system HipA family toxin [Bifidobacteriaceae bacterium]|jgi:serine/threonine-protein kinase HipA|nr:type II toxin-antitoxin system HipA family toxin [Bifidobacteriaceae bacterium]